jgi:GTPase SAR1 family protein
MYYRGAHAAILVYDVTSPESLEKVGGWVEELQEHANKDVIIVLAGNKCDLRPDSSSDADGFVSAKSGQQYADSIGSRLFHTSAKTGQGIEDLFAHVSTELLMIERTRIQSSVDADRKRALQHNKNITLGPTKTASSKPKGGCC